MTFGKWRASADCNFCKRVGLRGSKRNSMRGSTACSCDYKHLCKAHACTFYASYTNRILALLNIDVYEPWMH